MDIAQTTREVSQKISQIKAGSIGDVYSKTVDSVCNKCGNKNLCWQKYYNETMDSFNNLTQILKKEGKILSKNFNPPIEKNCAKQDVVAAYVNKYYNEYLSKEGTLRKVSQVRSVVTDQFEGMALMLKGFADEVCAITSFDVDITKKVSAYLKDKALDIHLINCYRDKDDRLTVQLYLPNYKVRRLEGENIIQDLSDICDRDMGEPEMSVGENSTKVTFSEREVYRVQFSAVQYNCKNGKISGDSYSAFSDSHGKAHIILSDGMGVGCSAAVDSSMTVSLIKKLISAGVGYEASLKIVNSALLVKSGEESLSTIDIATIDLHTAKAEFYKAGSAPTYVKRGDKVGYVESTSLPVGILNKVSFDRTSISLGQGDIVVVVSDGTSGLDDQWIRHTIERFDDVNIEKLSEDLAKTAKMKRTTGSDDDITVVVGQICKV